MTLAKKIGAKQLKKNAPYKNDCGQKKSEPNSVRYKNAPQKNDCCQKNQSKAVEKNVPYKNDCGEKNQPNSVGQKTCAL